MDSDWFRQELERKVREQVQHALGIEPAVPIFVDAPEPGTTLTLQTLLDAKALLISCEPSGPIVMEPLLHMDIEPPSSNGDREIRFHAAYGVLPDTMRPFHVPAVSIRDLEEMAELELALDHLQQQGTKFYTRAGKRKLDRTMGFVGRRRD